ncbi:hypothetical protein vBOeSunk162_26 [Oenococcus phage vB_OeS_unk162]|nr:hypothetical protein vBOeSunk162_26 [Oenococcus phage vB_OeS_unk162]QNO11539.1 hypothetical protein [Oenococcus phage Vinitor-27]
MTRYINDDNKEVFNSDPASNNDTVTQEFLLHGLKRQFLTDFVEDHLDNFYAWWGNRLDDVDNIDSGWLVQYITSDYGLERKFFEEMTEEENYGVEKV